MKISTMTLFRYSTFLGKRLHSLYYSGSYNRRTLFNRHLFNFFAYLELQICVGDRMEDPIKDEYFKVRPLQLCQSFLYKNSNISNA